MTAHTRREAGFTLIEYAVVAAIMLMLGLVAVVGYERTRTPLALTRAALFAAIEEARSQAATAGGKSSGALLVITSQAQGSRLTVLLGRPIPNFDPPGAIAGDPPVDVPARVTAGADQLADATLAFAPSGHLDLLRQTIAPGAEPVDIPPGCGSGDEHVVVTITDDRVSEEFALDCRSGAVSTPAPP